MSFADVRQTLVRDFVVCVEQQRVPPLSVYFAQYVHPGSSAPPDEYRLLPLTASALRFVNSGSQCATDCLLELQSKYQQFIPDAWGGRLEKGSRELGVIGFNIREAPGIREGTAIPENVIGENVIREDIVLEIQEIAPTSSYLAWAGPKLEALDWERLLIHAVIDFGRSCQAREVRLQPAARCPQDPSLGAESTTAAECSEILKRRYDENAQALGFVFDPGLDCYVLALSESRLICPLDGSTGSRQ